MRPGSVIIDLAAQTGGNCVYTEANKAVLSPNGVTIVGAAWLKKGERNTERPTALILQSLFSTWTAGDELCLTNGCAVQRNAGQQLCGPLGGTGFRRP